MRKSWTAAAVLVILSAACTTRSSEPLIIPESSKIQYVEVTHWSEDGGRGPSGDYLIQDRERIEAILALLRSNNAHYREDTELAFWDFFGEEEFQEYTAHFSESINTVAPLNISIGKGFLSGMDNQKNEQGVTYFRRRPLSESERKNLVALIARQPGDRDRY